MPSSPNTQIKNWSGNLSFNPREIAAPGSVEEIVALVESARDAGKRVRVHGAKHSWMPLIPTDDVLMHLDNWQGVEHVDEETMTATVRAGTRLYRLGDELFERGVSMANLGDIATQSIAGALFTGTHGTGQQLGILASQLVGVQIVTAKGEVLDWNEREHPDEMNAVRVSLGALGIVVKMTLRVQPAYKLHAKQYRLAIPALHASIDALLESNRHFEFFWFPRTQSVVAKTLNFTDEPDRSVSVIDDALERHGLDLVWAVGKRVPSLGPGLNRMLMKFVSEDTPGEVNWAHKVFPSPRETRFNEMEYNIPAEHWQACFDDLRAMYDDFDVFFPVESRWAKGDDIWLSPAYQRESSYIAVHQLMGSPYKSEFAKLEAIFRKYEGRPHWGKLNTMTRAQARERYPRFDDFVELRHALDPDGVFLNEYLTDMFSPA